MARAWKVVRQDTGEDVPLGTEFRDDYGQTWTLVDGIILPATDAREARITCEHKGRPNIVYANTFGLAVVKNEPPAGSGWTIVTEKDGARVPKDSFVTDMSGLDWKISGIADVPGPTFPSGRVLAALRDVGSTMPIHPKMLGLKIVADDPNACECGQVHSVPLSTVMSVDLPDLDALLTDVANNTDGLADEGAEHFRDVLGQEPTATVAEALMMIKPIIAEALPHVVAVLSSGMVNTAIAAYMRGHQEGMDCARRELKKPGE